jgi:hypothetical protein
VEFFSGIGFKFLGPMKLREETSAFVIPVLQPVNRVPLSDVRFP